MLRKSPVVFDAASHTYTLEGKKLEGITGMISRQLFPGKYANIPEPVLRNAAERGSLVHSQCELLDNSGIDMGAEETAGYALLKEEAGLVHEVSEYLVSDEEHFASCIDKVYREKEPGLYSLGDIKTTSKLDTDYLRWQLSIYAYLFERQNPGARVHRLYGIWLRGGGHRLVEVVRIPTETVTGLLACEVAGRQFVNPYATEEAGITLPEPYRDMEAEIAETVRQADYWANRKKELSARLLEEMAKAGASKWEGRTVTLTVRKGAVRKTFDSKAFQKENEELYKQYVRETPSADSLVIKTV